MTRFTIPACYFPSTLVFLHDGGEWGSRLADELQRSFLVRAVNTKDCMLQALQKPMEMVEQARSARFQESMRMFISNKMHDPSYELLTALCAEIYYSQRFAECSVLIFDHNLVSLDFCHTIAPSPIKKIILTDTPDDPDLLHPQKSGWIHHVFAKQNVYLLAHLQECIITCRQTYFQRISKQILQLLSIEEPAFLRDPLSIDLFQSICNQYNIVEYYLIDQYGSFLMLDKHGKQNYLMVRDATCLAFDKYISVSNYHVAIYPETSTLLTDLGSYQDYLDHLNLKELSS